MPGEMSQGPVKDGLATNKTLDYFGFEISILYSSTLEKNGSSN